MAKILFIDSEYWANIALIDELKSHGHEVIGATTAAEVIRVFSEKKENFTLVIIEILLAPGAFAESGIEILRWIREEQSSKIPVVAHTVVRDENLKSKVLKLGVEAYFNKPMRPTDFAKMVDKVLEKGMALYYSCFISYSSKDDEFVNRLYNDLTRLGIQCWFAPKDMKIGDKIRSRIDKSIEGKDKLLLVLSEHSINSAWVEKEVETAFEKERNLKESVFFPIRLDERVMDTDKAWAADIRRTRHIGNFSHWKDESNYEQAFERLLQDLVMEQ